MRQHHTIALIPMLALFVLPAHAARLAYPCYQPEVSPVVDGNVSDDPAWSNVPAATGFSVLGDGFTMAKQTRFQACWDDRAFYLAVVCEEPDVAQMKLHVRDGGDAWLDDGVEVFLQPRGGGPVYQFVVTAGGARSSGEGAPDFLKYQAASKVGAASYALEIRIPYELVGATPGVGDQWWGTVCRNIFTTLSGGDKFTSWTPLQRRFLEPERFAAINFLGPAPSADEAAAISEQLNSRYRADLARRLGAVAAQADEYMPALAEASTDAGFGPKARELRHQWRTFQLVAQDTSRVSVTDLREMLRSADDLLKASYELKYAYLIARLFPD